MEEQGPTFVLCRALYSVLVRVVCGRLVALEIASTEFKPCSASSQWTVVTVRCGRQAVWE